MNADFTSLLERLAEAGIEFVLVGGFAGVVHGCSYVTQDIDISCDFSPDNLLTLQKTLSKLEPVHRMTPNRQKLHLTKENCTDFKNLYLDTKMGQLDCLSFIKGVGDYKHIKQASRTMKLGKAKIRVLNLDALIKSKKAMGRPRDIQAVIQLEAIKNLKNKKTR